MNIYSLIPLEKLLYLICKKQKTNSTLWLVYVFAQLAGQNKFTISFYQNKTKSLDEKAVIIRPAVCRGLSQQQQVFILSEDQSKAAIPAPTGG